MSKGDVEYKETEIFELFPKFTYSKTQRKRCVLFHAYAKAYRKIINYAANFDAPNKICLVYIVGNVDEQAVYKALKRAGCSDRVCILVADFPDEQMRVWEDYDAVRNSFIKAGYWDEDADKPAERHMNEQKQLADYYSSQVIDAGDGQMGLFGNVDDAQRILSEIQQEREVIKRYERLKSKAPSYFKNWRLYRLGHLSKPFTHDKLDKLIRKIYPFGGESMGANDFAMVSPVAVEHGLKFAETGEQPKTLALTDEMIAPAAKAVSGYIAKCLDEKGFCDINSLRQICESPPYGLDRNGFSAACIARGLQRFSNRNLYFLGTLKSVPAKECAGVVVDSVVGLAAKTRYMQTHDGCLYMESHPHKVVKQFMSKLWGIKIEMPGDMMKLNLCASLCKTHRVPLSYVDETLLRLTLWGVPWYNRAEVSVLADDIGRRGDEILENYARYLAENQNVPEGVKSALNVDYSWAWGKEEYERLLWAAKKIGPYPWDDAHQEEYFQRRAEWYKRDGKVSVHDLPCNCCL